MPCRQNATLSSINCMLSTLGLSADRNALFIDVGLYTVLAIASLSGKYVSITSPQFEPLLFLASGDCTSIATGVNSPFGPTIRVYSILRLTPPSDASCEMTHVSPVL